MSATLCVFKCWRSTATKLAYSADELRLPVGYLVVALNHFKEIVVVNITHAT